MWTNGCVVLVSCPAGCTVSDSFGPSVPPETSRLTAPVLVLADQSSDCPPALVSTIGGQKPEAQGCAGFCCLGWTSRYAGSVRCEGFSVGVAPEPSPASGVSVATGPGSATAAVGCGVWARPNGNVVEVGTATPERAGGAANGCASATPSPKSAIRITTLASRPLRSRRGVRAGC